MDQQKKGNKYFALLTLSALGVVFGDIGTSPLYAMRECFYGEFGIELTTINVYGILSMIFWSLIIVITIKYLILMMRADNEGEGGILALMELVIPKKSSRGYFVILAMGLFGAALLYGDGMITPAISVLSAIEGLKVATPLFEPYVELITVVILFFLFLFQKSGTAGVGKIFGPIILIWFLVLAGLGIHSLVQTPKVLAALNPLYAIEFFIHHGWKGILILGAVFLVVTGGEALYADMGHFGRAPIRTAWFSVVLPCLVLNYFGQGALLLRHPEFAVNPFYHMAPRWALYPMVVMATMATIIASQAVISGAFSLTFQALNLGYLPRFNIIHTSKEERGQIYIPQINWILFAATVSLVLGFESSSNLAAAYGVAVTTTMVITSILGFIAMRNLWKWPLWAAIAVTASLITVDLAFFGSNLFKIADGGWFPLMVAGIVYFIMVTWRKGRELLRNTYIRITQPLEDFNTTYMDRAEKRVKGTAIYFTSNPKRTPPALIHNLQHNKVLHEEIVILSVKFMKKPHVKLHERLAVSQLAPGVHKVMIYYGFMDKKNLPYMIDRLRDHGLQVDNNDITYFLGRETLISQGQSGMSKWRESLFSFLSINSQTATRYFRLPPDQVFEVGTQIEL